MKIITYLKPYCLKIGLFLSWLIIPPLYLILSTNRSEKFKWKNFILTLISPMGIISTLVSILVVGIYTHIAFFEVVDFVKFTSRSSICKITEYKMPLFLINKIDSETAIRDRENICHGFFLTDLTKDDYDNLDELCLKNGNWDKHDSDGKVSYHYHKVWFDYLASSEDNYIEGNKYIDINIPEGEDKFTITYGDW